jgi:hypothetical protein
MNPDEKIAYEGYIHLIQQLDDLVAHLERHPNPETREQVMALINGLDMLHREGLKRLVDRLHAAGAGDALEVAAEDPVVGILLGIYDLMEMDLPAEPPPGFIPLEEIGVSGRQASSSYGMMPIELEMEDDGRSG